MSPVISVTRRLTAFFVALLVSVVTDQVTKAWAIATLQDLPMQSYFGDTFRWTFTTNHGAFLSLGSGLPTQARFWVLTVAVGGLLLGLGVYALVTKLLNATTVAGYGFIVGGGASNWFDRLTHDGGVVDFMNMGIGSLRTGVFNVADVAILVGIGLILIGSPKAEPKAP